MINLYTRTINNSSLFTVTLYSSVIPTPVYNDTQQSAPCVTLKPSSITNTVTSLPLTFVVRLMNATNHRRLLT